MRLPLPAGLPEIDVPRPLAESLHLVLIPPCGLPGTEVNVWLPNDYGLCLVHGRSYSGPDTFEATVLHSREDMSSCGRPAHVPGLTDPSGVKGWANAAWVAAALETLASLPTI